ncbi:uncharacterized protein LOC143988901 [Lithobates pipiens]
MLLGCVLLLQVAFLPVVYCLEIIQVPNVTVEERHPTVLRCDFNSSSDRQAVFAKFYHLPNDRNPMKNTSDGRVVLSHTDSALTMTIATALLCDAGTYVCVAELIRGKPSNGSGTELIVIANPKFNGAQVFQSYALQPVMDVIRVILLTLLLSLLVILIWKVW